MTLNDINEDLTYLSNHFNKYNPLYRIYGDYYNGKHKNYFKDFGKDNKNHPELSEMIKITKDNMCKIVVDSITARLQLIGLQIKDQEETQEWCDEYFSRSRITSLAKATHRDCVLYGDSYLLVWIGRDGEPEIRHEKPYNIAVKYDIDGNISYAVKWIIENINTTKSLSHIWFYTPEMIYKRVYDGITFPTDLTFALSEYSEDIPNPYKKVPLFHFYNGIRADAFCRSDLGDVVPLQIALNKELQSRELASDLSAFKQKWATGVNIPVDEDGKPISNTKSALDHIWEYSSPNVRLGEFSSTDLNNYTSAINDLREEISRVSRVPFHIMGLGGNFPSGEALKTAEAPLIAKIKDRQLIYGDIWEDVFQFVLGLAKKPFGEISAMWEDMTPHSELEQWQIALMKKDAGVSDNQILLEMGYTQDEIDKFMEDLTQQADKMYNTFNGIGDLKK